MPHLRVFNWQLTPIIGYVMHYSELSITYKALGLQRSGNLFQVSNHRESDHHPQVSYTQCCLQQREEQILKVVHILHLLADRGGTFQEEKLVKELHPVNRWTRLMVLQPTNNIIEVINEQ